VTRDELQAVVVGALKKLAPEADPATLDPDASLREELDLDSMDVLNLAIALHDALGVEIPETDYGKIASLRGCVDYLEAALSARGEPPG
jgi:acyl carrier protein